MSTMTASTIWWSAPARATRRKSSPIRGRRMAARRAFDTELARFAAFAADARGGISVTATQIDGSSADNIIVGSGPGIPSEVKVFGSELPRLARHGARAVLDLQPLSGRSLRRQRRLGLRRLRVGPQQHRHRSRAWHPGAGEGVQLFADDAARSARPSGKRRRSNARAPSRRQSPPRSCRSAWTIAAACRWPPAG